MKARIIIDIKRNIGLCLLILAIIAISDDCYWFSTSNNNRLILLKYGFFMVLPWIIYFGGGRKKIDFIPILVMTALFCVSALIGGASLIGGPSTLFFILLSAALFSKAIPVEEFAIAYIKVVNLLMVYSSIVWGLIMSGFIPVVEVENIAGSYIKTACFCTFFNDYFGVICRNGAIFREPGVFVVFVNIAFLLEAIFLRRNLSVAKLVLYVGCMLTTLSTAGLIVLFLEYSLYIYCQRKDIKSFIIPFFLMFICIVLLVGSEELLGDIFSKFDRGMESGSVAGRITSLTIPSAIIFHNPLFGVGAESFNVEYIHYGQQLYHMYINPQGLATNTILNAGAVYGLWFAMFLIIRFYNLSKTVAHNRRYQTMYVFLLFLMMFSNESMFYSIIVYVLVFYGTNRCNKSMEVR